MSSGRNSNQVGLEITLREAELKLRQHTGLAQLPSVVLKTLQRLSTSTFRRAGSVSTRRCRVPTSLKQPNALFQARMVTIRTLAPVKSLAADNVICIRGHCLISMDRLVQVLTIAL